MLDQHLKMYRTLNDPRMMHRFVKNPFTGDLISRVLLNAKEDGLGEGAILSSSYDPNHFCNMFFELVNFGKKKNLKEIRFPISSVSEQEIQKYRFIKYKLAFNIHEKI